MFEDEAEEDPPPPVFFREGEEAPPAPLASFPPAVVVPADEFPLEPPPPPDPELVVVVVEEVAGTEGLGAASYKIVECSNDRRSNILTLPSAPTEAKISRWAGDHATSYTSRSCAINCVTGTPVEMSQTVQV